MDLNTACAEYLKNRDIVRIMNGLRKKYESLGHVGGTYVLTNPSDKEREFLRGLFKRDYTKQKTISVSLAKFEQAFQGTRYEGVSLIGVFEAYFDQALTTRKELEEKWQVDFKHYFDMVIERMSNLSVKGWLLYTINHKSGGSYKWILKLYKEEADLTALLDHLNMLVNLTEASEDEIILPLAAARITKDPHSLDRDRELYKGFLYYLSFAHNVAYPRTFEDHNLLLNRANVLTNSVNRLVRTYGLRGHSKGVYQEWWSHAFINKEPLLLTDMNLKSIDEVKPFYGNVVYCFENPSVLHEIVVRGIKVPAICTHGQVNITGHRLLTLLEKSNVEVFYHGDFDPEGLLIADRLMGRYKNIKLMMYDEGSYMKALSNEIVSDKRMKQLDKLKDLSLKKMAAWLKKTKKAGYEEYLIEDLINQIETENLK